MATTGEPTRLTSTLLGSAVSGEKSNVASMVVVGTSSSSLQAPLMRPLSCRSRPMYRSFTAIAVVTPPSVLVASMVTLELPAS